MSRQRRAAPSISAEAHDRGAPQQRVQHRPRAARRGPPARRRAPPRPSRRSSDQRLPRSMPTMGATVTPAPRGSTRNSERPSGARAGTSTTSATWAQGTKRFTPERRQPSPARVAVAAVADGSQSRPSSSRAALARAWPEAIAGSQRSFWAALPPSWSPRPAQHHGREVGAGIRGAAHLVEHQGQLHQAQPRAALLLGEGQAEPAELGHLVPELLAVAALVVHHRAHVGRGALLVQGRAHRVAQQDLILAEREVHRWPPTRSARASLGSPRMRSPMTFFWISEEPA